MPYVPVPKDLTKVKTKVAFNLTKRQLICFSLAALVGVPVYFLTRKAVGNSAEKILRNRLRHKLWPGKRPYRTENLYRTISKKEVDTIAKNKTAGGAGKTPEKKHGEGKGNPGRSKRHRP